MFIPIEIGHRRIIKFNRYCYSTRRSAAIFGCNNIEIILQQMYSVYSQQQPPGEIPERRLDKTRPANKALLQL
ncbi:MAG TPA: hypothetical protein VN030_03830 [Cellvibrio sp.]|nr:hypothetical protein [Cellvibrio sp.]